MDSKYIDGITTSDVMKLTEAEGCHSFIFCVALWPIVEHVGVILTLSAQCVTLLLHRAVMAMLPHLSTWFLSEGRLMDFNLMHDLLTLNPLTAHCVCFSCPSR